MANADLCQRIICGAVSQAEAGLQVLYECSVSGFVGALPCSHPSCKPYAAELRARGTCPMPSPQQVVEMLPLHPPYQPDEGEQPLPPVEQMIPSSLVAPMPSITPQPAKMMPEETPSEVQGVYCQVMSWVAANQWMAAAVVIAGWWVLSKKGGR